MGSLRGGRREDGQRPRRRRVPLLTSAEATAYTIGEWVGWGVAIIGFEFFLTKGASFLAGLLPKASKLLLKIVQLSEKIDDIIGSLLSPLVRFAGMVDDVLGKMVAYMRHIKLPFVDEVFDALVSMKTKIMAFFEELIEKLTRHLDELTKSKKGKPDAPGKKPDPNAPGKPKDGTNPDGTKKRKGEEDENLRLEATKRAQSLWPRVPDEDMDTTSDWNRLLAKRFDKRTSGLRFEHEASVSANTWSLKVTAIDGTRWGSATAGKGWRADVDAIDDQHARGPWLAKSDKASANKSTLQSSIQDLEAAWQDAYWLDTGFDEAIAKAIKGENKDLDAASYDETDLFVDGDLATTKPDVRLVASPNTTSVADTFYLDLTHRKYEEHYLAAVDLAFEEHFQDFKAPWTKHIEETVPTFDWNRVPDWAGGVEEGRRDAAPKIDAFFTEKSRRESRKNPWDERLRDLLFQEARSALFSPALERAMDQLEKLLEGDEELLETLDLDYDAALIYVGQTTGVSSKLVKAVESVQGRKSHQRILGFLQGLVEGKQFNGVGYREFADNSSAPHQASWYATDKSGRMENARWTKDRFRDAREGGPTSTGQHEWIPSNMIADMVTRDRSPSDAAETASWVDAQHELRTDTSFIVFPPTKSADLQQAWEDFVNQAQGSATPADFIEGRKVQASSFSLAGHTGALYLREDETRPKVPQTKGQGTFHDTLRNLVKASSTPDEYKTKLRKEVRSGKLIWNGKLAALTPDGWNEGDVKPIPIDYQGTKDVDLGKTLEAYGEHVRNTYRSVTDMLGIDPDNLPYSCSHSRTFDMTIPEDSFSPGVLRGLELKGLRGSALDEQALATLTNIAALRDVGAPRGLQWFPSLKSIDYRGCEVVDISALGHRPTLRSLAAWSSHIQSLAGIDELFPRLLDIDLFVGQVQDLRPLLALPELEAINVVGNPLDDHSFYEVVPTLFERGVTHTDSILPQEDEHLLMRRFVERGLRMSAFTVEGRMKVSCPGQLLSSSPELFGISYPTADGWHRLLDEHPDADERALFDAAQADPRRMQ